MTTSRSSVRVELANEGSANIATGLPVLDHLVGAPAALATAAATSITP